MHAFLARRERRIIEFQGARYMVLIEMKQRRVPPIVKRKAIVILGPIGGAVFHEPGALLLARLHFHHMDNGMACPAILRLDFERAAA